MFGKKAVVLIVVLALVAGFSVGAWSVERQPHMAAALEHLKRARNQLEKAVPDKGGHRVAAIKLVDQAIAEVKLGIEVGNEH